MHIRSTVVKYLLSEYFDDDIVNMCEKLCANPLVGECKKDGSN